MTAMKAGRLPYLGEVDVPMVIRSRRPRKRNKSGQEQPRRLVKDLLLFYLETDVPTLGPTDHSSPAPIFSP